MTVMLGQQCGTPCDACCACGAFCSNVYCGRDLEFNITFSGASDADAMVCATCADIAGTIGTDNGGRTSYDAATWNSTYKPACASHSAKSGTTVCKWADATAETLGTSCGVSAVFSAVLVYVYYGTDNKWYLIVMATYDEGPGPSYTATVAGEQIFPSSGAPMDCGSVGEGTPTFSLTVALALYDETGTAACFPPTTALVEGNPQ